MSPLTLERAHQLALNKLVELLQTLTDPSEIRRVATAILRIKPPKDPVPPVVDQRETAGAEPPLPPTAAHAAQSDQPPSELQAPSFPDDLNDEDLESVRNTFISRDAARAPEFRAMSLDQFRAYLRDIFSYLHTHAAQHAPEDDDDDEPPL